MNKYQCRKCKTIKTPDGQGCKCGESWASLTMITSFEQDEIKKKHKVRFN